MPKIEIVNNQDYFKNWDSKLRHKNYPISRSERRAHLQQAYMNWYNSGIAFAYVSDYGDTQFKKTKATAYETETVKVEEYTDVWLDKDITWIVRTRTNYPLFQSIRSIVQRAGHECKCESDTRECICDNPDTLAYIRGFAAQYNVRFILAKREFHRLNCLINGCGNVVVYWTLEDPLRVTLYRHGAVNPWEIIKAESVRK